MPAADLPPGFTWSTVVPELLVSDLDASLRLWCGLCGFAVAYERLEDRFAYLDRVGRQIIRCSNRHGQNLAAWLPQSLVTPGPPKP